MSEGDGVQSAENKPSTVRVEVGGEQYTVNKFKGFKAFRLGRMLTELGEIGPQIQKRVSKFVAEYREDNVERIPRAVLEFRYPEEAAAVSEKAWEESGGVIALARDPGEAEILAVALPAAFELAGDKIVDLLAWVVANDQDLQQADETGEEAVQALIVTLKNKLLYRGDIDELLELALAAKDVISVQMAGKAERARSLLALVGLGEDSEEDDEEVQETEEERQVATPEIPDEKVATPSTSESTSTSERPDSSTDSPPPTDGDEETSFTDRAGEQSMSTSG